jgi:hypothetical protein
MSEHDEIPEDVAYAEFTFSDGVVHRVPVTPEQARRWLEGKKPIAYDMNTGEPFVDDDDRLIEEHRNTVEPKDDAA